MGALTLFSIGKSGRGGFNVATSLDFRHLLKKKPEEEKESASRILSNSFGIVKETIISCHAAPLSLSSFGKLSDLV